MTSGIEGTGPYAKLKNLRKEARDCRYELDLIKIGYKRQYAASTYLRSLKRIKEAITVLNAEIKAQKGTL